MPTGRIPYAGRAIDSRYYDRDLLELMQLQSQQDQQYRREQRLRSEGQWNALSSLPARLYETYRGVKDQQRAEEDRQRAEEDRQRLLDRQVRLDEIADEERAQSARTLAYEVGRQRIEDVAGQDAAIIRATLGDLISPVLPDPPAPSEPLYLPEIPLTDPRREERVGPRQLTPAQGLPQGKPLGLIAEIPSPLEGQTERIPIPDSQKEDREAYLAREEKIALDAQAAERAGERELKFAAAEREAEAEFEKKYPDIDVVFFYKTDKDGNKTRVAQNKETLEVLGEWPAGVEYQADSPPRMSQTSMLDQARVGFGRVLAGEDPGKFSYAMLAGSVTDPRHLEAKAESYRDIDSPAYKSYFAERLSDNPKMKDLVRKSTARGVFFTPEDSKELENFEQEVQQTYLDAHDRWIAGEGQGVELSDIELGLAAPSATSSLAYQTIPVESEGQGVEGMYYIDPDTNKMEPLSAALVSRLGLKPGEEFELPSGQVVTALEWPQDISLGGEAPR
jgi:hypothetical protein